MVNYKSKLNQKDKLKILDLLRELPTNNDFYVTKDRQRLFLKENPTLLFKELSRGDKILWNDNGMAIVTGYADKEHKIIDRFSNIEKTVKTRKYVKILARDKKTVEKLLRALMWNIDNQDLYIKIQRDNFVGDILKSQGFFVKAGRGKEILYCRKIRKEYNANNHQN